MEFVPWQLARGWRPARCTKCFRCCERGGSVENPCIGEALRLPRRKEPERKSIAVTLMRDVQGTAAQKLAMFEKVRAAGGFANEDPPDLAEAERMLREFAAMEKGK